MYALQLRLLWLPVRRDFEINTGYFTSEQGYALRIYDSTKLFVHVFDQEVEAQWESDTSFMIFGGYATFRFASLDKPVNNIKVKLGHDILHFYRYEPQSLSSGEVDEYVGTYESEELDSRYQIVNVDGKPVLSHSKYPDTPLTVVTRNQFTSPVWWMIT